MIPPLARGRSCGSSSVPVIQCAVDERANHAHCGRLGRVVVIELQIAATPPPENRRLRPTWWWLLARPSGNLDRPKTAADGWSRSPGRPPRRYLRRPGGFSVVVEILDRADPAPGIAEDASHLGVGADLAAPAGRCVVEQGGARTALRRRWNSRNCRRSRNTHRRVGPSRAGTGSRAAPAA